MNESSMDDCRKAISIVERKSSIPLDDETFDDISKAYDITIDLAEKAVRVIETFDASINNIASAYPITSPETGLIVGKEAVNLLVAIQNIFNGKGDA